MSGDVAHPEPETAELTPEGLWQHLFGASEGYLVTFTGKQSERPEARPNELDDTDQRSWEYPGQAEAAAQYLSNQSEAGRDVYFGVHLFAEAGNRRKDNAAAEVAALWVDGDGAKIPKGWPQPTVIVASSPGREHYYWRLARTISPEEAAELNKRLSYGMEADKGKWGLGTVLRPPATRNYKRAEPTEVAGWLTGAEAYDPEALDAALPATEEVVPGKRSAAAKEKRGGEGSPRIQTSNGEPPVALLPADREAWEGTRSVISDGGGVDRSRTLHWIACGVARGLRRSGISEAEHYRIVEDAVAERDASLGYDKYTARDDRSERYAELADEAVAEASHEPVREAGAHNGSSPSGGANTGGGSPRSGGGSGGSGGASGPKKTYMRTDLGNAERFVDTYRADLRWCTEGKRWIVFDGTRWLWDEGEHAAHRMAHSSVRSIFAEAQYATDNEEAKAIAAHASNSQGGARIEALLAQAKAYMNVSMDDLDRDIWLINAKNGTLDPRTGQLREHRREDLMTKCVPFDYDQEAQAPVFFRFLEEVLPDPEVRAFVQRYAGYSITGSTKERVLAFLHGGGKNGKSTLVEALREGAGEYAQNTSVETILSSRGGSNIPNDVAALKGARLVSAAEPEKNRRVAESKVKNLTGSDTVTARFMRGEFFDFKPEFKLWISMNHKPIIVGTDDAIWDRIRLVPFNQRFAEQPDTELPAKLAEERAGIFAWMVRGALDWYANGLGCPEAVAEATQAYRGEMDTLGEFFEEHCVLHPAATVPATDLYQLYESWCASAGEEKESQTAFGHRLSERGFESFKFSAGPHKDRKGWRGIGFKADSPDPEGERADSLRADKGFPTPETSAKEGANPPQSATGADSCGPEEKRGFAGKTTEDTPQADSSGPKSEVNGSISPSRATNRTNYPLLSAPSASEAEASDRPASEEAVGLADDTREAEIEEALGELDGQRRRDAFVPPEGRDEYVADNWPATDGICKHGSSGGCWMCRKRAWENGEADPTG